MKNKLIDFFQLANRTSILRAIKVALIVSIILNIINNPELFSFSTTAEIRTSRILLTFLVPFCVSLYSSMMANKQK